MPRGRKIMIVNSKVRRVMIVTPRVRRDTHNIKTNILRVRRVRRVTYRVMKVTP